MRLIHKLIFWRYGIPADFVLNDGPEPDGSATAEPVAAELLGIIKQMKAEAFDVGQGRVNYTALRGSPTYTGYCRCARRLQSFDPSSLPNREERLAFWINLYNALIVDGVIQFNIERTVNEVPGFFWRAAYNIGGHRYNSFDIEYGIVRANAPHPAIPGPHFAAHDPRLKYSLDTIDARIHFALVCAAKSCPPIAVYDAEQIDDQLDLAARSFINGGGVEVDIEHNEVRLSKIFQWYAPDFGGGPLGYDGKKPLLKFIAKYLAREDDRKCVCETDPKVTFMQYDWRLNR